MSDLIKREDAIKAIEELPNAYNGWSDAYDKAYIIGTLEEVPSADRPQGEWIAVSSYDAFGGSEELWNAHGNPTAFHYCSKCKAQSYVNEFGEELLTDYCPNCGCRMKGADDE